MLSDEYLFHFCTLVDLMCITFAIHYRVTSLNKVTKPKLTFRTLNIREIALQRLYGKAIKFEAGAGSTTAGGYRRPYLGVSHARSCSMEYFEERTQDGGYRGFSSFPVIRKLKVDSQ